MDWPDEVRRIYAAEIEKIKRESELELKLTRAIQFFFFEQWRSMHQYCTANGVKLIGDVAIFVDLDSADVWNHPEIFQLDEERNPINVSGVPQARFSNP